MIQIDPFRLLRAKPVELGVIVKEVCDVESLGLVLQKLDRDLFEALFASHWEVVSKLEKIEKDKDAERKRRDKAAQAARASRSRAKPKKHGVYSAAAGKKARAATATKRTRVPAKKGSGAAFNYVKKEAANRAAAPMTPAYVKAQKEARDRRKAASPAAAAPFRNDGTPSVSKAEASPAAQRNTSEKNAKSDSAMAWAKDYIGHWDAAEFASSNGLSVGSAKGLIKRWVDGGLVTAIKDGRSTSYVVTRANGAAHVGAE
jgi:hypothetical protein